MPPPSITYTLQVETVVHQLLFFTLTVKYQICVSSTKLFKVLICVKKRCRGKNLLTGKKYFHNQTYFITIYV